MTQYLIFDGLMIRVCPLVTSYNVLCAPKTQTVLLRKEGTCVCVVDELYEVCIDSVAKTMDSNFYDIKNVGNVTLL